MKSPDNPDHHTVTESLAITVGDYFPVGDRMRRLTPRLAEATNAARSVLIEVAQHREVITYGELSDSIGRSVLPRHMGPLLSMIAHDCAAGLPGGLGDHRRGRHRGLELGPAAAARLLGTMG